MSEYLKLQVEDMRYKVVGAYCDSCSITAKCFVMLELFATSPRNARPENI